MIGVTRNEAVTTIEMQRPERRNALNSQLVTELREAVLDAATHDVRAIVLTGQGSVTDVVLAVGRAELTLQTAVAVRDRVVAAYQDVMRMPI